MIEFASILNLTICFAVPLLLVALGGMYSERSGVINIALDGIMIMGALVGCLVLKAMDASGWGDSVGKAQLGVLLAALIAGASGIVFSLLLAFAAINLKADQTIGGTALNIFAPAFAVVLAWAVQGQGHTDISIPGWTRLKAEALGITGQVNVDFLATFFKKFYITIPLAVILLAVAWFVLFRTRFGLRLRSCGEHPQAAASVGISVYKMRYSGVMISGFLGGVGGLAYVLVAALSFTGNVGGYGFLALAVMIFGNWMPGRILFSALFFALFKVIGTYYKLLPFLPKFEGVQKVSNLYNLLPYIVTLLVLIFTSKKSRAPKAEGIPYDKGMR
ncbi:MAG: ABC transporter permease [Oscillospiraceae bacterium]|nr:ABC transporter permease [Oscillospiraceae bacterium]